MNAYLVTYMDANGAGESKMQIDFDGRFDSRRAKSIVERETGLKDVVIIGLTRPMDKYRGVSILRAAYDEWKKRDKETIATIAIKHDRVLDPVGNTDFKDGKTIIRLKKGSPITLQELVDINIGYTARKVDENGKVIEAELKELGIAVVEEERAQVVKESKEAA